MLAFEKWGLSTRLTVLCVLAVFLGTSAGGWVLRDRLHIAVERSFEAQLKYRLDRLLLQFETGGVPATQRDLAGQGDFGRIFSGWYWVLVQDGVKLQSRSSWDSPLDPSRASDLHGDDRLWTLSDATGRPLMGLGRVVVLEGVPSEVYVFGPMEETLAEWHNIDRVLLVTQFLLLLVLAVLTVLAVRWGLKPLRKLQHQMQCVQQGKLPAVGQGFSPDLDPLASSLDQVLSRNAEVVARAQHQAADLSHSLKKPLALMTLEARKPEVAGPWLMEQVRALSSTIDRHLARVGSGAGTLERVNVCAVLHELITLMQRIHGSRNLNWDSRGCSALEDGPYWRGTRADLEEMLGNLLDNAGKWASSRVQVTVERVDTHADQQAMIRLVVEDDGQGVSSEQLLLAGERGQRFDEAVPGHGLGLAIVRDLAETHKGRLNLRASPMGGLQCELHLPTR